MSLVQPFIGYRAFPFQFERGLFHAIEPFFPFDEGVEPCNAVI